MKTNIRIRFEQLTDLLIIILQHSQHKAEWLKSSIFYDRICICMHIYTYVRVKLRKYMNYSVVYL